MITTPLASRRIVESHLGDLTPQIYFQGVLNAILILVVLKSRVVVDELFDLLDLRSDSDSGLIRTIDPL